MNLYRNTFPKKHTLLTVIHCVDEDQAARNMRIAQKAGADGAFLINHDIPCTTLVAIYKTMRKWFPDFWAGVNFLDLEHRQLIDWLPDNNCGLWADNAGVQELGESPEAKRFLEQRNASPWEGLYFGGVAFKYQKEVSDPAKAALAAVPFVDVITTSGKGTGFAPDVEKIRKMKVAISDHPLAIASGTTPENVHLYKDYVDCFLVATGISDSHTELNADKTAKMIEVLRA